MTKKEKLVELRDKYRQLLREGKTEEATNIANKMNDLEQGESEEETKEPEKEEEKEEVFRNQDSLEEFEKIDGVGPELAMILQERFGKVENIVKSDKKKLLDVSGIGKKKVESIRKEVSDKW